MRAVVVGVDKRKLQEAGRSRSLTSHRGDEGQELGKVIASARSPFDIQLSDCLLLLIHERGRPHDEKDIHGTFGVVFDTFPFPFLGFKCFIFTVQVSGEAIYLRVQGCSTIDARANYFERAVTSKTAFAMSVELSPRSVRFSNGADNDLLDTIKSPTTRVMERPRPNHSESGSSGDSQDSEHLAPESRNVPHLQTSLSPTDRPQMNSLTSSLRSHRGSEGSVYTPTSVTSPFPGTRPARPTAPGSCYSYTHLRFV